MTDEPTLRVRGVHRAFGGIAALSGVDLDVAAGEVRALVGGNGSGKSTLIKIIGGVLAPDRGVVEVGGVPHRFRGAADAHRAGVAAVHQELGVVPTLSVVENVFLGHRLPRRGMRVDWRTLHESAHELLSELGRPVDVTVPAGDLTPVQRTTVVIARALARDARVLLLDEPTVALTETESAQVFQVVRRLRARGVGVLYTTHRLAEVSSLCDQVTVLRDGQVVGAGPAASYREDDLITAMVGEDVGAVFPLAETLLAQGVPLWVALAAVPLAGAVVGLVNGVLVAWFGLSAFVATLATMTSLGGLSLLVTSGATLFELPGSFLSLGQGEVAGVPVPVLFAIAVGGLVWLLLTQTTYSRRLHAVGGNAEVAAYSGIDPRRVRLVAFVLSALGAAIAGVLLASRLASAHPTAGDPLMLTSIAAVFIGMTVRRDNTPNIPGTLLGVVLLGVLANGLNLIGVSSYLQQVLTGLIIVTAVGLPKLLGGRS